MKICLFVYEVFLIVLDVQKNKFLLELLFLIQLRFQFETANFTFDSYMS